MVRLIAAIVTILCGLGVVIAQRQLYQPVNSGRLSVHEYGIVVIAESAVSLSILFYRLRRYQQKRTVGSGSQYADS
jgi:hypothetical protein